MKWIVILLVGCACAALAGELDELSNLTNPPVMQDAEGFQSSGTLKAIYYDALDCKGKPTKVFAWLGLPENCKGKVPGIVLVHGGGGTAFKEWVQKWTAHGFAAISIAVEGQLDVREYDNSKVWKKHAWAGPARTGIYGDLNEPLEDQWMYHAVADTILANSLLRSLPEVDADKVGLMGISWGGVITSTVIGLDDRFAFAIPTYGCGNLAEAQNQYGKSLGNNELYKQVWDPLLRLNRAKMPVLWFSWPQDQHFPLDKQAACYRAMPGPVMVSLIPGMGHGHAPAWNPPDSYSFAESVVYDGQPWCRQTDGLVKDNVCEVTFISSKPLENAVLVSTTDTGVTGSRTWVESPATLTREGGGWIVSAPIPAGTTAWFINVHSGGLTVSSEYNEVK
jgi:dienelactone hydrolase